uniref:Uncharacterized protein n=1 Tax=Anguilla anguilla TaxID=7936 RepID=A0A0E9W6L2_ANGAN
MKYLKFRGHKLLKRSTQITIMPNHSHKKKYLN